MEVYWWHTGGASSNIVYTIWACAWRTIKNDERFGKILRFREKWIWLYRLGWLGFLLHMHDVVFLSVFCFFEEFGIILHVDLLCCMKNRLLRRADGGQMFQQPQTAWSGLFACARSTLLKFWQNGYSLGYWTSNHPGNQVLVVLLRL